MFGVSGAVYARSERYQSVMRRKEKENERVDNPVCGIKRKFCGIKTLGRSFRAELFQSDSVVIVVVEEGREARVVREGREN